MESCKREGCVREAKVKGFCQSHYSVEHRREKAAANPPPLPVTRVCTQCGETFQPKRERVNSDTSQRRRFCSPECKRKGRVQTVQAKENMMRRYYRERYNMTLEDVNAMKAGGCAICGVTESLGRWRGKSQSNIHIDHDHASGLVRGPLCHGCNVSIGHFNDDPELLRRAAAYLEGSLVVASRS